MAATIYIAGKISGDPNYKEKFNAVQKRLESEGYIVLSPAWLPPAGFEYEAYMRISKAMLIECNEICLLPDWKDSNGAFREYVLARELGIKIRFLDQEHGEDVVPVVRCKDCKKWGENGICNEFTSEKLPTGGRIAFKTNDNDYCSYGVRKDGEKEND